MVGAQHRSRAGSKGGILRTKKVNTHTEAQEKTGGGDQNTGGGFPLPLPCPSRQTFSGFPLTYGPNSGRVKSCIALAKNYCFE